MLRNCETCGIEFFNKNNREKWCACCINNRRLKQKTRHFRKYNTAKAKEIRYNIINCIICGIDIQDRANNAKYCLSCAKKQDIIKSYIRRDK